nr:hypothetical protein [Tanacetum cinerariifolium]
MLKEALAKCNIELQAFRKICAKIISKLQSLGAQLQSSNSQTKTTMSQTASGPPSVASFLEEGNDDEVSVAGSWATTMISELSHNKKDKSTENTSGIANNDQVAVGTDVEKSESDYSKKPNGDEDLLPLANLKSKNCILITLSSDKGLIVNFWARKPEMTPERIDDGVKTVMG